MHNAELVTVRICQHHEIGIGGILPRHARGTQSLQTRYVALLVLCVQIEVKAVSARLRLIRELERDV